MTKLIGVYREAGATGLAWRLFSYFYKNFIRTLLPRRNLIFYAGIPVDHRRAGDQLLPQLYNPPDIDDAPDYEQALVTALKAHVKPGDRVTVVGVGSGVTCVIAALAATNTGCVNCFEGDFNGVSSLKRVARLNGVSDRINVHYAVVGEAIGVYGNAVATTIVHPTELPRCDVLELDCEGAEVGILRNMTAQPRIVAVETHGFLGAPTSVVREILESRGYSVYDSGWAEPRFQKVCIENDIRVLIGTLCT